MHEHPALPCPACGSRLEALEAAGHTLLGCARCAGVWVDNATSQLAAQGTVPRAVLEVTRCLTEGQSRKAGYREPAPPVPTANRACPTCHVSLERVHVAEADVELDVCRAHGTWFDMRELERVHVSMQIKHASDDAAAQEFSTELADDRRHRLLERIFRAGRFGA